MFFLGVYRDYTRKQFMFSTLSGRDFSFSTGIPGGFLEGSMTIDTGVWDKKMLDLLVGKHVVISDSFGEVIYEGKITGIDAKYNTATLSFTGYYAQAKNTTFGILLYTAETAKTSEDILNDAIYRVPEWKHLLVKHDGTFVVAVPKEFQIDTKVIDVVEGEIKNGFTDNQGRLVPITFVVYEDRTPRFGDHQELMKGSYFMTRLASIADNYGSSITLDGVFNKIQVKYTLEEGEDALIDWAENKPSQEQYGVIEGTVNAGKVPKGIAQVAQDLAMKYKTWPMATYNFTLKGDLFYLYGNQPVEPYMLRAGAVLYVADLERPAFLSGNYFQYGVKNESVLALQVLSTSYSGSGETQIEAGITRLSLDFFLTDMGISGGDVS